MNEYKNEYEDYYGEIKRKYLGLSTDEYEEDEHVNERECYNEYLEISESDIVPKNKVSYSQYARAFAENNRMGNIDDRNVRGYDNRRDYYHRSSSEYLKRESKKSSYLDVIMYEVIGVAILAFAVFVVKTSPIKELNLLYKQCKEVVKITCTLDVENTPVFKNIQNAISDLDKKMKPIDVDALPQKQEETTKDDEKKQGTIDVDSNDASNL